MKTTPSKLTITPNAFFKPKRSRNNKGANRATQTTLRLTNNDDAEALTKTMPTYCKKYAMPLVMPKKRIKRFFSNLKLKFFVSKQTASITREAARNLRNTNEYASMYCKPIFMAGKGVAQKKA